MSDMRIWKFPIRIDQEQFIAMPAGARILSVAVHPKYKEPGSTDDIYLWAEVDAAEPEELRRILVFGTGHPLWERRGRFIGTVLTGPFVWHVYDPGEVGRVVADVPDVRVQLLQKDTKADSETASTAEGITRKVLGEAGT